MKRLLGYFAMMKLLIIGVVPGMFVLGIVVIQSCDRPRETGKEVETFVDSKIIRPVAIDTTYGVVCYKGYQLVRWGSDTGISCVFVGAPPVKGWR